MPCWYDCNVSLTVNPDNENPSDGAIDVSLTKTLAYTAWWSDKILLACQIYLDGNLVFDNTGVHGVYYYSHPADPFTYGIHTWYIRYMSHADSCCLNGGVYSYTGAVWTNSDLWTFTTIGVPGKARNPIPINGQEEVIVGLAKLQWDAPL